MPEFEIIEVIKSKPLKLSFSASRDIKKKLKKVGWRFGWLLFWQHCIQIFAYGLSLLLPDNGERILPTWKIKQLHDINISRCHNINHESVVNKIKKLEPDLIVSAYFNQILKPELIDIPRLGILNIHPGWLPAYRGAMSYFWVLKNGSDKAGVSVHWIDKGIDTGALIKRRSFRISERMTQQNVLVLTAVIGAKLLQHVARTLINGETPKTINADIQENSYYPMPAEKDFDDYFKQRRFFRIRDVFLFLLKKIKR